MPKERDKDLLLKLLTTAVNKCYSEDICLIERSMERTTVSRIFLYMYDLIKNDPDFEIFKEYNLDCEYNKNGDHLKSTIHRQKGTLPDIILHKRMLNDNNLLVVEFKTATGRFRYDSNTHKKIDFVKLEDFTRAGVYNYFLGVFVRLGLEGASYKYFQAGEEKTLQELSNN